METTIGGLKCVIINAKSLQFPYINKNGMEWVDLKPVHLHTGLQSVLFLGTYNRQLQTWVACCYDSLLKKE